MNCDSLARWYRWLEYAAFGRELERRREHFLPTLGDARRALVLGDGDGRFLAALLRTNPLVRVQAVDNSGEMLRLARRRIAANGNLPRIDFHHADVRAWRPPGPPYDLIVTHFFLDCFTNDDLAPLVEQIAEASAPAARWIVSEFRQPERGLAKWCAKAWIAGLYRLFGLTTGLRVRRLPDYAGLLEKHGFEPVRRATSHWGLLTSECWQRPGF